MDKLAFLFSVSFGSLFLGYIARRVRVRGAALSEEISGSLSKNLKLLSIFIINPIPIVDTFWKMPLGEHRLFVLPLLGLLSIAIGGLSAVALNHWFRIPPKRAASVFTAGMFTNILSFGGLIAFVFFGVEGYGLVQLFNMFISAAYYVVGFPVSRQLSLESREKISFAPTAVLEQPFLFVPIGAILLGIAFNLLHLPRPVLLDQLSAILIPVITAILGFAIGITLHLSRLRGYRKEISLILLIKFVIVPIIMIPMGIALGLPGLMNGVPFKVLVIVSVMPVAFNALVPPAVYGFDLDLANSAWVISTMSLAVVLPALYFTLVV